MTPQVKAEGLGKCYTLKQDRSQGAATLVETLARKIRGEKSIKSEPFWALKDVSFEINPGDRLGIIGKNGAGKSTLLKILSRITEPTEGKIRIRGRVSSLLEVGTGFHPELTGRENIFLNGAILGMPAAEIRRKFDEIVAFAEVERFLDTPVKRYSSGMFTRLGFAVAAHLDPDLLIVDEVLAVGDLAFQEKCIKKLDELGKGGRSVLFVSHDIGNILNFCNKGLWLDKGQTAAFGPVEEVVGSYLKSLKTRELSWQGECGDEHIRFHTMSLLGSSRGDYITERDQPELHLEYEVLKSDPDLLFGFSILNASNQVIARSHTSELGEAMHRFTIPGHHKVSFPLPAPLFSEGEYAIRLDCVIHNKKTVVKDEIYIKFPLFSSEKISRYHHADRLGGVYLGPHWIHHS